MSFGLTSEYNAKSFGSGFGYRASSSANVDASPTAQKTITACIAPNLSTKPNFQTPKDASAQSIKGAVAAQKDMRAQAAGIKEAAVKAVGEITAVAKANNIDLGKTMTLPTAPASGTEMIGSSALEHMGGGSMATFLEAPSTLSTLGTVSDEGSAGSTDAQEVAKLHEALLANSPVNWKKEAAVHIQDSGATQLLARPLSFNFEDLPDNAVENLFALASGKSTEGFPELVALENAIGNAQTYLDANTHLSREYNEASVHSSALDAMDTKSLTDQTSKIDTPQNAREFAVRPNDKMAINAMFTAAMIPKNDPAMSPAPGAQANADLEPKQPGMTA